MGSEGGRTDSSGHPHQWLSDFTRRVCAMSKATAQQEKVNLAIGAVKQMGYSNRRG